MNQSHPRVLVAGIGNIFFGDDAFGVEVVRRMLLRKGAPEIAIMDFGIRGLDLAFHLQRPYELALLVDAFPFGGSPGALRVLELGCEEWKAVGSSLEAHSVEPLQALRFAAAQGPIKPRVLLVGCQPHTLESSQDDGRLTPRVAAAVETAVELIDHIIDRFFRHVAD